MNFQRGLFRIWLFLSVSWVIVCALGARVAWVDEKIEVPSSNFFAEISRLGDGIECAEATTSDLTVAAMLSLPNAIVLDEPVTLKSNGGTSIAVPALKASEEMENLRRGLRQEFPEDALLAQSAQKNGTPLWCGYARARLQEREKLNLGNRQSLENVFRIWGFLAIMLPAISFAVGAAGLWIARGFRLD